MSAEIPDLKTFRDFVNEIPNPRDQTLIKALYLSACRVNELCTKSSPSDTETSALGNLTSCKLVYLKKSRKEKEPILLLTLPVSKRKSKRKEQQVYKKIALPCSPRFEPWVTDLLKWIVKNKSFSFPLTRQHAYRLISKALKPLDSDASPHRLRHYRLTHLKVNYSFKGWELSAIAGWSLRSGERLQGTLSSEMENVYIHTAWKDSLPKLLKPLNQVINEISISDDFEIEEETEPQRIFAEPQLEDSRRV